MMQLSETTKEVRMDNALAKRWMDLLGNEGYRPVSEVNEDNPAWSRLQFRAEGKTYMVLVDENDPTFHHVQLAYDLRDRHAPGALARAANHVSQRMKGAKATVDDDASSVRFHLEWFQEEFPSATLLDRILSQLATAASEYLEKLGAVEPIKAMA
jgi:hypothetical protein